MPEDVDYLRRLIAEAEEGVLPQQNLLAIDYFKPLTVKIIDLAKAVEANKEHPVAAAYLKAIRGCPPQQEIVVSREDLRALLENREVLTEEVTEHQEDGTQRKVLRKRVGDHLKPVS